MCVFRTGNILGGGSGSEGGWRARVGGVHVTSLARLPGGTTVGRCRRHRVRHYVLREASVWGST